MLPRTVGQPGAGVLLNLEDVLLDGGWLVRRQSVAEQRDGGKVGQDLASVGGLRIGVDDLQGTGDLFVGEGDHVGNGLFWLVVPVDPVDLLIAGQGDLLPAVTYLDGWDPLTIDLLLGQLVDPAENRTGGTGDQSFPNSKVVNRRPLIEQGLDNVDIEGIGGHDFGVRESGLVKHLPGLGGQLGDVSGIDPDTDRLVTLSLDLLEDPDSVRHPRLEDVIGVDQERDLVRVDLDPGLEGAELIREAFDPGMGHGPGCRDVELAGRLQVGGAGATADHRGPGTIRGGIGSLSTPGPKFHDWSTLGSVVDLPRLGGDQ